MALAPCPECRREVSSLAASCPHCGAPIKPVAVAPVKRHGAKYEIAGTVMLLGGVIAWVAGQPVGALFIAVGLVVFIIGRFQ